MVNNIEDVKSIYPYEDWKITERKFEIDNNYRNETIFSIGNGYIGMRGTFEEGYTMPEGKGLEGTFINGFYESEVIKYGELAYAYPQNSQSMLNVTNSKVIQLTIDDEVFSMFEGEMPEYSRILDLKKGTVERKLIWISPKGKKVEILITKLVSFTHKHVAAIRYEVIPLNFNGRIKIKSLLDGDVVNSTTECNSRIDYGPYGRVLLMEDRVVEDTHCAILQKVKSKGFKLACSTKNSIYTENGYCISSYTGDYEVGIEYTVNAEAGKKIRLDKFISYITSLEIEEGDLKQKAIEMVTVIESQGFEKLIYEQKTYLEGFWHRADIEIKGDPALQQGIRFNMFQLLQSAGRDGKTSMGAKGLSGEGYEGHCFWDTEMYVLPFFIYNSPKIARSLLEYRYNTLDKARDRAREMSIGKGALYPWRTINGEEASAYYPAGTAQVHINADIAFAVQKYIDSTGDTEFAGKYGVEILVETARFWVSFGSYIETKGGKFCINGVTGPDEFAVLVNNNAYTNMLAKENLLNAYKAVQWMKKNSGEEYVKLCKRIGLKETELEEWKQAADNMYIPIDEKKGIYPQDDSFMYKKTWDIKNTPAEKFPLLNHNHPLVVYRHQVSKQADLVLALCLLSYKFTKEDIKKNFDFYETVTVHESSLSACIFSIVANNIGYYDKAYEYFMRTSRLDLDDYHRDTKAGIHCANMAGTWMSIVNGFAGMRVYDDILSFEPNLPEQWEGYSFKLSYRGRLLNVEVSKSGTKYELLEGGELTILHNGEKRLIGAK